MAEILSVGIDIGTSTTQVIFSRIAMENTASYFAVPHVSIVDKRVVYKSAVHVTPLLTPVLIDGDAVRDIVAAEFEKAGYTPADTDTGAVIITGESARKENAAVVLEKLSGFAGEFVVSTAGPDLESVIAGKGSGAWKDSLDHQRVTVNLDVGGGTTNIAVYEKGTLRGVCCLDIGGRLIKVDKGKVTYLFPKIQALAKSHGIDLQVGEAAEEQKLRRICALMADQLAQSLHLKKMDGDHAGLYTNDGKPLPAQPEIRAITFSGGVADCVYQQMEGDLFRYGDIGVLLGQAIRSNPDLQTVQLFQAAETIRATVVGAGTHTTEVSGSTIHIAAERLPIKNIPILKVSEEDEASLETFRASITRQMPLYKPEGKVEQIAIAFNGETRTSFAEVQDLAAAIIDAAKEVIDSSYPLILVVEADIGKVLGNAVNVMLSYKKDVICIDGIKTLSGDYVDIGEPVADGHVVPVVIKTLIFNS